MSESVESSTTIDDVAGKFVQPMPTDSAATIRQQSIDELFSDINSAISRVNRSDNWLQSDKYTVDDMFLNSVAEPRHEEGIRGSIPVQSMPIENPLAVTGIAAGVNNAMQSLLASSEDDIDDEFRVVPVPRPVNNTPFQTPLKLPSAHPTTVFRGSFTPADSSLTANSGYDIEDICDYLQAILWSAPTQELHVTVLGTIFHRGCDVVISEKLLRKSLFQEALELCLQTSKCLKIGEGVDYVIALNDSKKRDKSQGAAYTFLEKIIVWILKDELTNSHPGNTLDGSDFVNMKILQNAVRSKKTEEGLFKFSLNLIFTNNKIFSVPNGFLTDIPLENSSYSALFNQAIGNLQQLGIVQCLDDNQNRFVRLGEKARSTISPQPLRLQGPSTERGSYSNAAAGRGSTKSQQQYSGQPAHTSAKYTAAGGGHGGRHGETPHTPNIHSSPYTTRGGKHYSTSSKGIENQADARTENDLHAAAAAPDLPLIATPTQQLEKALRVVEDDNNTVVFVPSVLKMSAILDAMNSGYIQRVEYESGCTIRDISESKEGNEDQRVLIRGTV